MSNTIEQKLKSIRKAEGVTQKVFAELTGISLGTVKNYETGFNTVGMQTIQSILRVPRFKKYTMWLMTDTVAPEAGQIAPSLSPDGLEIMSNRQKTKKVG